MHHRSFNVDEALDGALEAFWSKGYTATSVDDLCQSMNIGRSSLYQAFGSKPQLLEIALDRYTNRAASFLTTALARPGSFRENVRDILQRFAEGAISGDRRRGCFIGEMIAEFPATASRETRILEQKVRILKAVIESGTQRAVARGELDGDTDPEKFAHFLFATIQGLRLTGKISPDSNILQAIIDAALSRVT
ncbi:MAG: TetR/AcrR family transcriptional regulator [Fimbriimonadaceae bacterium]|nr:TetR/AcrR family transcriptional regulator [Alphaproteobacteria bacterium]